jgi:hypothetical protein
MTCVKLQLVQLTYDWSSCGNTKLAVVQNNISCMSLPCMLCNMYIFIYFRIFSYNFDDRRRCYESLCNKESLSEKGNFEHFQKIFRLWAHSLLQINCIKFQKKIHKDIAHGKPQLRRRKNIWSIKELAMYLFYMYQHRLRVLM